MIFSSRNKKRILIFLIIPLLAIIPLISDDIIIKSITAALLIIYVAFIIFLRDSVRIKDILASNDTEDFEEDKIDEPVSEDYDTDLGESIKIVSKKKSADVITSQNYSSNLKSGLKSEISTEDLKEQFDKIVGEELPTDVNSDEQFIFVLEKILNVIKDAYLAHSVVFFWYNDKCSSN
jgi:hypothetical protein